MEIIERNWCFCLTIKHLIIKLLLICNKNLLVPWTKMVKSSNEGSWLQTKRWSSIELSADGFTFLKLMGKCRCVLLTLLSSTCQFHCQYYETNSSSTLKFINITRHKVLRKMIFKTESVWEIYLIFENYLDFTTT